MKIKKWLIWSTSLFFLMCLAKSWAIDFANTPKLVVKGEASIFKPADQMEASLGVLTVGDTSPVALNENNQHIRQIITNLKELGLDESDYKTGRFNIHPVYQKPSKDSLEPSKISHYEVVNTIEIKTMKIALVDKILNAAVQGGANQIDQVQFNLHNPQSYREEVIKLATQYALLDAYALSNAADVKLVRILNLSLDHWQHYPGPVMLSKRSEGNESNPTLIEPGQAEIHATVNVTFEIDSEEH